MSDFARKQINRFKSALNEAHQNGDKHAEAKYLGNLGSIFCWHTNDDIDQAIDYHQQALTIALEIGDKDQVVRNLVGLGDCYGLSWQNKGEYPQATAFFKEALAIAREITDRKRESDCLSSIGGLLYQQHDYQASMHSFEQALAIARELDNKSAEANNLYHIGQVHLASGHYQQAIECIEQSMTLDPPTRDKEQWQVAHHLGEIASIYYQLDDRQSAISYYERGLEVIDSIPQENAIAMVDHVRDYLVQGLAEARSKDNMQK